MHVKKPSLVNMLVADHSKLLYWYPYGKRTESGKTKRPKKHWIKTVSLTQYRKILVIDSCQAGDRSLDHLECTSALTTLFALFKNGRTALLCWSGFEVATRHKCVCLNLSDKLVRIFLFKNWTVLPCQTCLPEICTSIKLQTYWIIFLEGTTLQQ